ncbi:hypothetical protein SRRS_26190 [Sporomusa rhizae]|uniref:stage III sporulation protein AF n=1 Tax=Sporomusa rhizae TaxID=357999 RepID=UPI00352A7690
MIESITLWIKSIIFVVLFASFLELLLPSNNMQRFVRVILGLFIMLAILNPVIGVIEKGLASDQLPALAARTENNLDLNILSAANNVAGKREQIARDMYIRDLSKQIRATVLPIDGVADAKVTVSIDTESDQKSKSIGKIKNVVIYIEPGIPAERKVTKITINHSAAEVANDSEKLPSALVAKVKKSISELYQIKANQIEVKRLN